MENKNSEMNGAPKVGLETQSITKRLTLSLIVSVLIVSAIAITAMDYVVSNSAKRGLERKADEVIIYLTGILDMPLWTINEPEVTMIGKAVSQDEAIVLLVIKNEAGAVVYSQEKQHTGELIARSGKIFHKQNREIYIGEVYVSLTQSYAQSANRLLLFASILIIVIILTAVVIVTRILIRTSLRQPLKSLSEIANSYASGTYESDHRLPYVEFQPFGKVFTQMAHTITNQIRDIRLAEAKYRSIFENSLEGIFQTTPDGLFLSANPALAEILGYDSSQELMKVITDIKTQLYVNPKDREVFIGLMKEGKPVTGFHIQFYRKDRSIIIVSLNARPVCDENGELIMIEGVLEDITERKQAEEARRRLEERLRRAEKMEVLGTLAGGVAHDLNNVLGVLVGYSELLLYEMSEESPWRKHVFNIMQSSQRATAIIQDLLTLTRRGVAVSEVVNLNKLITDYFKTSEFQKLKEHYSHVTFKTDLEKDLLNIKGSPIHLEKTLMNLVSNAAEAVPENGDITIRTENRYLDKPIQGYDDVQEGDYVVLTVSDNGKGISPKDLEHIFEPFFTKKVMGRSGTGLGLTVVWGTVKDHDGYIDVKSEEGQGTTFMLYFPVTRDGPTEEREATISPEVYMGRGESILVVDDVQGQRELAVAMLSKIGYDVTSVSSGEEAVSYIKTNKVDLLVLDMIMEPGIDGLETYQRILEINPRQKAIIVSGFSETERVKKAQKLGAGSYVRKPYIMKKIGLVVRRELDRP